MYFLVLEFRARVGLGPGVGGFECKVHSSRLVGLECRVDAG